MSYDNEDLELPGFHEAPEVNGLALSFWSEQGLRQPKRWWHPLRRARDVALYALRRSVRR